MSTYLQHLTNISKTYSFMHYDIQIGTMKNGSQYNRICINIVTVSGLSLGLLNTVIGDCSVKLHDRDYSFSITFSYIEIEAKASRWKYRHHWKSFINFDIVHIE